MVTANKTGTGAPTAQRQTTPPVESFFQPLSKDVRISVGVWIATAQYGQFYSVGNVRKNTRDASAPGGWRNNSLTTSTHLIIGANLLLQVAAWMDANPLQRTQTPPQDTVENTSAHSDEDVPF
jgi:hypothetical protein